MYFQAGNTMDYSDPSLTQFCCPLEVCLFVETRFQFNDCGDIFSVFGS